MPICIGLDLAWSARNPSGGAVIVGDARGGEFRTATLLGNDEEIVTFVLDHAGDGPAIVAIDAPLHVPNESGRRPVEDMLARAFRVHEAGPYPANRRLLAREGVVRGEALVAVLARHGFVYEPMIAPDAPPRQISEVFPHPASIALFNIERTLKYKARPGRSMEIRLDAFRTYQQHLLALVDADPPLHGHEALLAEDMSALAGRRLKDYEDKVDGLLCAYIALYGHRWGAARCRVFGDMDTGAVFTPVRGTRLDE